MPTTRSRRCGVAFVLLLSIAGPVSGQVDTIPRRSLFTWRDAAILEGFAIATVAIAPLDLRIAERLQDSTVQESRLLSHGADFVRTVADPGAFVIGIGMYTY